MTIEHVELFDTGAPGDRIEMHEERDARPTGRVLTARILGTYDIERSEIGKVQRADSSDER